MAAYMQLLVFNVTKDIYIPIVMQNNIIIAIPLYGAPA